MVAPSQVGSTPMHSRHRFLAKFGGRRAGVTTGAILHSRTGEPLSKDALYLMVRRRGEQTGIERLHTHVLRHTCATRLLVAGMQEADVRVLLGWSRFGA
ncbi:MAG: tyrosine-type recombinase/integrase [Chloroflexi bacterium]|nr:tyrosine-type recombinase/integrase [Chloroflexota bacterium]